MTVRLELLDRRWFADGQAFGDTGPYERLTGRAHYALDPRAPAQQSIFDIEHAPVGHDGLVHFAGDWSLLRPVELDRGNRRILFDWGNRGNKRALPFFNDAAPGNDPITADDAGNGFLMRRGYSVLWGAWQGDLLPGDNRMLLDLPVVPASRASSASSSSAGPACARFRSAAGPPRAATRLSRATPPRRN